MTRADLPPADLAEALARARQHTRAAASEAAAALRALLDALALVAQGRPAEAGWLGSLASPLDQLRHWLDDGSGGEPVLDALRQALDEEIRRWEERSREDPEARSVLRAFLAVREVLWEITAPPRNPAPRAHAQGAPGGSKVQRLHVEG